MTELRKYNLKKNPFEDLTPTLDDEITWAGLPHQKEDITKVYKNAFVGQGKRIILNWGPYGGGKTHAAYYFGNKNRNEDIDKSRCIHLYVRLPREESPIKSFVSNVSEYILFGEDFTDIVSNFKVGGNQEIEENLYKIFPSNASIVKSVLILVQHNNRDLWMMYLNSTMKSILVTKLRLTKTLKTDEDSITFLCILLQILTLNEDKRIFLWVDEMENMIFYPAKKLKSFSDMIRDITDTVNKRMITFFNFSLSDTSEDTVKLLLGEALWLRISSPKIRFKDLTYEDAMIYCKELINQSKIELNNDKPFSDDLMNLVIKNIPQSELIPRELNRRFDAIITYAIQNDIATIDINTINSALQTL